MFESSEIAFASYSHDLVRYLKESQYTVTIILPEFEVKIRSTLGS